MKITFILDEEIEASFTDESIVLKENNGHKIGGFPLFTQEDPREYSEEYAEYSVLLFQLTVIIPILTATMILMNMIIRSCGAMQA